jgi:hypothetical protein
MAKRNLFPDIPSCHGFPVRLDSLQSRSGQVEKRLAYIQIVNPKSTEWAILMSIKLFRSQK